MGRFLSIVAAPAGATIQTMLVAASALLVIAPPAEGTMLIVPILPARAAVTLAWALPAGAALVAPGPYPGSIVVHSKRDALLGSALAHGALVLTARFPGCVTNQGLTNDQ